MSGFFPTLSMPTVALVAVLVLCFGPPARA
jgi:hypothetical protein